MLDRLKEDMLVLGRFGAQPGGGVSRPSFSEADIEARRFIIERFEEAGLEVHTDAAGNIVGLRTGSTGADFVTTGSHIDTVLNGGMFDGALGVVGGLEALRMMNEDRVKTKRPIALLVFTDEEGAYSSLTGSSYFAGKLTLRELHEKRNRYSGERFAEGVARAPKKGYVERLPIKVRAHVELHVEQGPILEANNRDIGVVTGIVGIRWFTLTFKGRQAHAGTTPMDMRSDPVVPLAQTILDVRRAALAYREMVGTVGRVEIHPNVVNVIAGEASLTADMRSLSSEELDRAVASVRESARRRAKRFGVQVQYTLEQSTQPVACSARIQLVIEQAASSLGYTHMYLPSRAGHDTQNMASLTDEVGMVFVPSRNGVSHAPDEWTDWDKAHGGSKCYTRRCGDWLRATENRFKTTAVFRVAGHPV